MEKLLNDILGNPKLDSDVMIIAHSKPAEELPPEFVKEKDGHFFLKVEKIMDALEYGIEIEKSPVRGDRYSSSYILSYCNKYWITETIDFCYYDGIYAHRDVELSEINYKTITTNVWELK